MASKTASQPVIPFGVSMLSKSTGLKIPSHKERAKGAAKVISVSSKAANHHGGKVAPRPKGFSLTPTTAEASLEDINKKIPLVSYASIAGAAAAKPSVANNVAAGSHGSIVRTVHPYSPISTKLQALSGVYIAEKDPISLDWRNKEGNEIRHLQRLNESGTVRTRHTARRSAVYALSQNEKRPQTAGFRTKNGVAEADFENGSLLFSFDIRPYNAKDSPRKDFVEVQHDGKMFKRKPRYWIQAGELCHETRTVTAYAVYSNSHKGLADIDLNERRDYGILCPQGVNPKDILNVTGNPELQIGWMNEESVREVHLLNSAHVNYTEYRKFSVDADGVRVLGGLDDRSTALFSRQCKRMKASGRAKRLTSFAELKS